ncbi:MAG: hypothetical protein WKF37_10980 [Bryobacteraceae bacterium]
MRLIEEDGRFRAAVRKGKAYIVASSSRKKRWTPTLNKCSALSAYPLDAPAVADMQSISDYWKT